MTDSTSAFQSGLAACIGGDETARPFICAGDPRSCEAFLVGTNPASSVPFWPFWNDTKGIFDKARWFECYRKERANLGKRPESPTRRNIEQIVAMAAPVKVLETNLFSVPTQRAADLHEKDRKTQAFEFLLDEIKPRILLLHGQKAKNWFERRWGCSLTRCFSSVTCGGQSYLVAGVPHLFNASRTRAQELGEAIRHQGTPHRPSVSPGA